MVHINPKFANRALPPIPVQKSPTKKSTTHVNPNFLEGKKVQKSPIKKSTTHVNPNFLDGKKAKAYEEAIKMAVESKIQVKVKLEIENIYVRKTIFQFLILNIKS